MSTSKGDMFESHVLLERKSHKMQISSTKTETK